MKVLNMRKSFQYKAKMNKKTEADCLMWLSLCCRLYNICLEQRILFWKQWRISATAVQQMGELPALKAEFPEFKQVGSQALQDVVQRLDRAFKSFFRRLKSGEKPGFPRFRSRDRYDSFTLKQAGWKLEGRILTVTGLGRFKLFLSRPIEGKIKTVTIRRSSSGKWFVFFSCDEVPATTFPEPVKEEIGIDVGISSFLTDSEGSVINNPQPLRRSEQELRRRQRSLSRKKKGSSRRKKAKVAVAEVYEKITDQRRDFINKSALLYVLTYGTICIESLNIRGMVKNRHLSKSISDAAWGLFFNVLCAEAEEAGRTVVKVNPRNTSRLCSECGILVPKKLSVRVHHCPFCGLILDRDENAARNIVQRGRAGRAGVKLGEKPELA